MSTVLSGTNANSENSSADSFDSFLWLPIEQVQLPKQTARIEYDAAQLAELTQDIRTKGLLQPIIVKKKSSLEKSGNYEVISGFRRLVACRNAELKKIPVRIETSPTSEKEWSYQLSENLQRKDLHPIEISLIIKKFIDLKYKEKEIAYFASKSVSWVSKYKKISLMPNEVLLDPMALQTSLTELLFLESHFPKHKDLIKAWEIFKANGLQHVQQLIKQTPVPTENHTNKTQVNTNNVTREFMIVTRNQNVLNCRMQINDNDKNELELIIPKNYSVEELEDIFEKILKSMNP